MLVYGLCSLITVFIFFVFIFKRCDGNLQLIWNEKFGDNFAFLSNQVVWITGVTNGVGESIAYCLAEARCKLVLSDLNVDDLERVKTECLKMGRGRLGGQDILILPMDPVDFESHPRAVQRVMDHFQKIDILINNAGYAQKVSLLDEGIDVDKQRFEINVLGPMSLTQLVAPHMIRKRKGHVVVTGSLPNKTESSGSWSISGNPFAVNRYFDRLRAENRRQNIGVTMICPGSVYNNLFIVIGKAGELLGFKLDSSGSKMTPERCAYWCCVAIANRLNDVWICERPYLLMAYITQYIPDFARWRVLVELFYSGDSEETEKDKMDPFQCQELDQCGSS